MVSAQQKLRMARNGLLKLSTVERKRLQAKVKATKVKATTNEVKSKSSVILKNKLEAQKNQYNPSLKYDTLNITKMNDKDYAYSKIINCKIKNKKGVVLTTKNKYIQVIKDIWANMEKNDVLKHTTFNIQQRFFTTRRLSNGYDWFDEHKFYYSRKGSCIYNVYEILKLVKINKLKISIVIQYKDGKVFHYEN